MQVNTPEYWKDLLDAQAETVEHYAWMLSDAEDALDKQRQKYADLELQYVKWQKEQK